MSVDQLFALAFRDNAFDLVQPTICTRCAMLHYIAANLTRATALASFGGSSLDTLGWSHAIRFEAGIGGGALCIGRVYMDGVCGGRRRRVGEVVVHWIHCVCCIQVVSGPGQFKGVSTWSRQCNHSRVSAREGKRESESQAGPTDSMNGGATSKTGIAWSVSTGPPGVPTRAIHQRTKVLFPQHGRSGSSTSYLRFSKHSPAPRVEG